MSTLLDVVGYLQELDYSANVIRNAIEDGDSITSPVTNLLTFTPGTNLGNLEPYVATINICLRMMLSTNDITERQMDFRQFDVAVASLRTYLNSHWWQFAGAKYRTPLMAVPPVTQLSK